MLYTVVDVVQTISRTSHQVYSLQCVANKWKINHVTPINDSFFYYIYCNVSFKIIDCDEQIKPITLVSKFSSLIDLIRL